jgi:enamine deaminase RidA (YjgF/YER057c/UK114 family)
MVLPSDSPLDRLAELGLELPPVTPPAASYQPAVRSGSFVYTAGQLPLVDGKLTVRGKVGSDVMPEVAAHQARICALNALAAVHALVGLPAVARVVKVVGFVASTPDFTDQPAVINGASELLLEVFGDLGAHARSAVGVAALPMDAPVEVELVVEIR